MKKRIIVILVIAILSVTAVGAASPSTFDFGILNYYRVSDLADQEFSGYTPGIRLEGHITPWFGLGADVILQQPFVDSSSVYSFLLTTDVTFRTVVGFFEPYLGLGPAYLATLDSGDFDLLSNVAYNARAGFDFNITDMYTLGIEGKLLVGDLQTESSAFDTIDWLEATMVGVNLKIKL